MSPLAELNILLILAAIGGLILTPFVSLALDLALHLVKRLIKKVLGLDT